MRMYWWSRAIGKLNFIAWFCFQSDIIKKVLEKKLMESLNTFLLQELQMLKLIAKNQH